MKEWITERVQEIQERLAAPPVAPPPAPAGEQPITGQQPAPQQEQQQPSTAVLAQILESLQQLLNTMEALEQEFWISPAQPATVIDEDDFAGGDDSSGQGDTTPPQVTSSFPVNGANGVPVNQIIESLFNEPVELVDSSLISLTNSSGTKVSLAVTLTQTASGSMLLIDPETDLQYQTTYTLTISAGAERDLVGNANSTKTITFTTKTGFKYLKWYPGDDYPGGALADDFITIYYTVPIKLVDDSLISLQNSSGQTIALEVYYDELWEYPDEIYYVLNIIPVDPETGKLRQLKFDTEYTLTILPGAITDDDGNFNDEIVLTFKTEKDPAETPPYLLFSVYTGTLDKFLVWDPWINLYFNEAIAYIDEGLITLTRTDSSGEPLGDNIPLRIETDNYPMNTYLFRGALWIIPKDQLEYETTYTFTVQPGAVMDTHGQTNQNEIVLTFTTEPDMLVLQYWEPKVEYGEYLPTADWNIELLFNRPLAGIAEDKITLTSNAGGETVDVKAYLGWMNEELFILRIEPLEDSIFLEHETTYILTIQKEAIKATGNKTNESDIVLTFTTAAYQPLQVVKTNPADGDASFPISTGDEGAITISFNIPIKLLNENLIQLSSESNPEVNFIASVHPWYTNILRIEAALAPGTEYTLVLYPGAVADKTDDSNVYNEEITITFTTAPPLPLP